MSLGGCGNYDYDEKDQILKVSMGELRVQFLRNTDDMVSGAAT